MKKAIYDFVCQITDDKILERKTCKVSWEEFPIYESDDKLLDKFWLNISWKQFSIPRPTLCPEQRAIRRLAWRNERKLYKRRCDLSGKLTVSIYSDDKPYKVYSSQEWRSDKWDATNYGREFDFSKTFFNQFDELMHEVPLLGLVWANNENSEYINLSADNKNCYIVIESSNNEDCYHCYWIQKCDNCTDCSFCHECSHCYELENCRFCYNLKHSNDCQNCKNSMLLAQCENCEYCFGCTNLHNKKYHIFNQEVSESEYNDFINSLYDDFPNKFPELKKQYEEIKKDMISQEAHINNVQNCVWDYINSSKNTIFCIDSYDADNNRYGEHIWRNANDTMDCSTVGRNAQLVYETINCGIDVYHNLFCAICRSSSYMIYCYNCFNSNNCFGCVWLRNKEYCILNKQYTEQEYKELVPKIIDHMKQTWERWEFFPVQISPFGYNESMAWEYEPLTKDEALQKWYKWMDKEYPINVPEWMETLQANDIPQNIDDVDDDILNKAIICAQSGRIYRLVKPELEFYRKHKIAVPRKHPDIRHNNRCGHRHWLKLYMRNCDNCVKHIVSCYDQNFQGKVFCKDCFAKNIY